MNKYKFKYKHKKGKNIMTDTLPDISVDFEDWTDPYSETSLSTGTSLLISNKSTNPILLYISDTKPATSSQEGIPIGTLSTGTYQMTVTGSPAGVWLKSYGTFSAIVNVSEYKEGD